MLIDPRPEVVRVSPERNAQLFEELVHAIQQGLRCVGCSVGRWGALKHNHSVRKVCGHDEIMLYNKACPLGVEDESVGERIQFV